MKTRSQTRNQLLQNEFTIDFDESSALWMQNKKKLDNGCYEYTQLPIEVFNNVNLHGYKLRSFRQIVPATNKYNTRSTNKII
jgi:hypothetical protein